MTGPDLLGGASGKNPRTTGSGRRARRRRPSSRNSTRQTSPPAGSNKLDKMYAHFVECPRNPEMMEAFEAMLDSFPPPCPRLKLIGLVGEGTFSNVYLVDRLPGNYPECRDEKDLPSWRRRYAIKHLVPTAGPQRIITEIECLKLCQGRNNVLPLLFCIRLDNHIIFGMPYIEYTKFADLIENVDFVEMKYYFKNLLMAIQHIHSLGIIHRDLKPGNFLYDRTRRKFGLVDFGLAQRCEPAAPMTPVILPQIVCRKRLSEEDFDEVDPKRSPEPTLKARKISLSPGRGRRPVLEDATLHEASVQNIKTAADNVVTPSKKIDPPAPSYYDKRGSLLKPSPKKKTNHRERLEANSVTPKQIQSDFMLRRSPRKHPGSMVSSAINSTSSAISKLSNNSGYSTLKIAGNTIYAGLPPPPTPGSSRDPSPQQAASNARSLSRANSFTMIDPTSGIPSPRASLTPNQSTIGNLTKGGFSGICSTGLAPFQFQAEAAKQNLQLSTKSFNKIPAPVVSSRPEASNGARCFCYGKPLVCKECTSRRGEKAARAGTPGFRPPEVLLKHNHQTTAVDMWAVGIMLLSMLTRTYPFFRAQDDMYSLAEIACVHGTDKMIELAAQFGKKLIFSQSRPKMDLLKLCYDLSRRPFGKGHRSNRKNPFPSIASPEACDLLEKLLVPFHPERISAERALQHPLFNESD